MTKLMQGLSRWSRALVRQLPDKPYPSDHPWRDRHDPARPRWLALAGRADRQGDGALPGGTVGDNERPPPGPNGRAAVAGGGLDRVPWARQGATGTLHIDDPQAD